VWQGRRVLLGVTGGIAAYKSVLLARGLTQAGAEVDVVLSRGAQQFVGAATFEAISGRPVRTSLWEPGRALEHIALARDVDLVIVAPATAQFMARAAAGMADDLLTSIVLARTGPVLIAPAMNDDMYANAATVDNLHTLLSRGWLVAGPAAGALAEGPSERPGRMLEPDQIMAYAARAIAPTSALRGLRVLVTAGPTREAIDPVRYISNRSSGKMGYRLAEAAWIRGASVTLVSGPSAEHAPIGVSMVRVESTTEMADAVAQHLAHADVLIMAAAPADFRPAARNDQKMPRSAGATTLALEPTDDILASTRSRRGARLTAVGFALETGDALAKGQAKLARKGLDLIVVNDATEPGAGFDVDTNVVSICDRTGRVTRVSLRSKAETAGAILDAVEVYRG
jgi:phosphopantothenoylcysteine decarboxylase/phosphopantothenate--cysteine ligase